METPSEFLDNPEALSQAVADAENLLARYEGCIAVDEEGNESVQPTQDETDDILSALYEEIKTSARFLSAGETDRINSIVDRLSRIKRVNNEAFSRYLTSSAILLSSGQRLRTVNALKAV